MWVFPWAPWSLYCFVFAVYLVWGSFVRKGNIGRRGGAVLVFATIYIFIVLTVLVYSRWLEYKVNTFDLNGDLVFSADEESPEFLLYFSRQINDAGRNFAPLTAAAFSLICSMIFYLLLWAWEAIERLLGRGS